MWKNVLKPVNKKILHIAYKTTSIVFLTYIALSSTIPRNTYSFLKELTITKEIPPSATSLERLKYKRIRYKLNQDIRYHELHKNWYKKTIAKIVLNEEGKIIGYKMSTLFYPNYFTKTQLRNVIPKSETLPFKKTNINVIKVYFN